MEEVKAGKVSPNVNDYILIFDLAKNFYKDLHTLFIHSKPKEDKFVQFYINSTAIIISVHDTLNFRDTHIS